MSGRRTRTMAAALPVSHRVSPSHAVLALVLCGLLPACDSQASPPDAGDRRGNIVSIAGSKGAWTLMLNGSPFDLKGVGVAYARGMDGADYLALAREMGANTVRTWGVDQGTPEYLDLAGQYGLYVNAGIWLNQAWPDGTCSYVTDNPCTRAARESAIAYVNANRHHPAVLFWNIGNETIQFTTSEDERLAFCAFLEDLVQEVHAIDPDHPVIYTSAHTTAVEYIQRHVPSLDVLGLNIYGGLEEAHQQVISRLDIPYIVTEYGPLGPWDRAKDANGKPIDQTDMDKAGRYKRLAKLIEEFRGFSLGGFAFVLGDKTTQTSLTWWNLTVNRHKRLSFLILQRAYTGQPITNKPPFVMQMDLSKERNFRPGEAFEIRVRVREPDGEDVTIRYLASTDREASILEESPNEEIPLAVDGEGAAVTAIAPSEPGIYRIYVVALDPNGLAGTLSRTISVQ